MLFASVIRYTHFWKTFYDERGFFFCKKVLFLTFRSKAADSSSSNTSSSEDLESLLGANRAFSGVVIDPVPAGVRKSSTFDDHSGDRNDSRDSDNSDNEDQSPQHHQQQQQHQEAPPV